MATLLKSLKKMFYTKYKREKFGICNICLKEANLSWDHVPPKGGIEVKSVEMESILSKLNKEGSQNIKISQNGVKYRTICKECNQKLGSKYDITLNKFSITVGKYLKSNLVLPKIIYHKTKPTILVKAILGHLLTAKSEIDEVKFDKIFRKIIFDDNEFIPNEINIFYWIYPYEQSVVIRDSMMPSKRGKFNNYSFFHSLKYFPIAYLVSDLATYESLPELTQHCTKNLNDEIDIPIYLNRVEHPDWPEIVDEQNIFCGGKSMESSILARPKK